MVLNVVELALEGVTNNLILLPPESISVLYVAKDDPIIRVANSV